MGDTLGKAIEATTPQEHVGKVDQILGLLDKSESQQLDQMLRDPENWSHARLVTIISRLGLGITVSRSTVAEWRRRNHVTR